MLQMRIHAQCWWYPPFFRTTPKCQCKQMPSFISPNVLLTLIFVRLWLFLKNGPSTVNISTPNRSMTEKCILRIDLFLQTHLKNGFITFLTLAFDLFVKDFKCSSFRCSCLPAKYPNHPISLTPSGTYKRQPFDYWENHVDFGWTMMIRTCEWQMLEEMY